MKNAPRSFGIFVIVIALFCVLAMVSGCANGGEKETPQRYLAIEGDVTSFVSYKTGTPVKNAAALPGDKDFEGVALPAFLSAAEISGAPSEVWLISSGDGFAVRLSWDGLEKAYLIFSDVNGWQCVAPEHPVSANAQDIDRIIVVSEGSESGLRVVGADGRASVVSFGKMLIGGMRYGFHFEGEAEVSDGAGALTSRVYTREFSVALADVYEDNHDGGFVVITNGGEQFLTDGNGRFRIEKQRIDYIEPDGDEYEDVAEIQLR